MKNKILSIFVLAMLLAPVFSSAIPIPTASLTIVVNTQGQDSSFHFDLEINQFNDFRQFDIQTQNLTGLLDTWVYAANDNVKLTQDEVGGLKVESIYCASDDPAVSFSYSKNTVSFSPRPWTTGSITCTFNNIKTKTPVLIVPGLLGTELKDGDELLWADLDRMVTNISDNFMDPLAFNKDLSSSDESIAAHDTIAVAKLFGIDVFDYTNGLINEFKNQGYIEGENLFTFPYDWRYGVTGEYDNGKNNSDLLGEKINEILQQTGADKVDVVAHSLGGLVVKQYVAEHAAGHHIGKAVFVGVPNTGAPKAVKVLVQGDNLDILGLNDQEIKKISQNMPAVYDLLPSQQYYDRAGTFIYLVNYPNAFSEPTEKDLNYQESKDYLLQDKGLNSTAMSNAEGFHTKNFDDFDLRAAGVELYAINGCKTATMTGFVQVDYTNIFGKENTDYARVELKTGDGTVPIQSATNLPIDQNNNFYFLPADHSKMLSADGSRQKIVNLISGSNLDTGKNFWGKDLITQDINECQLNGKAISVFSPINISVTDQSGNKLGLAQDQSLANEIPGADFEIWGGHKFVFLPTDSGQTYLINMQGTGSGEYTIKSDNIQDGQITGAEVFTSLSVTSDLTGQINISANGGQTTLAVKENPTAGTKIILPSEILVAEQAENYLPPVPLPDMPTSKDQCKKDGWKNFGGIFKNQGDCVSYVVTGGKRNN